MKPQINIPLHISIFLFAFSFLPMASAAPGDRVPDHYIVQVEEGTAPGTVLARHGLKATYRYDTVARGFAGFIPPGKLRFLQADPEVISISPDRVVSAIARGGTPGAPPKDDPPEPSSQTVPSGVIRIGAAPDDNLGYTGAGVGVAICDTGVDLAHPDLTVVDGFSAFGVSAQDEDGHGTHVCGIVLAVDNDIDVVGVAPGATGYAVQVLDANGSGTDSSVLAGLNWIASQADSVVPPIRVANLSLGRPGTLHDNPSLRAGFQALRNDHGITVVVAAGNDCALEVDQQVPATYPEVIAVGSTTAEDGRNRCRRFSGTITQDTTSFFSSDGALVSTPDGPIGVTISAPGAQKEDISKRCFITSEGILSTSLGGGTERLSGTSMAAPHVAGVAALLYEQAVLPLDPETIRTRLINGAVLSGVAPYGSPTSCYTPDGDLEGVLSAPGALAAAP